MDGVETELKKEQHQTERVKGDLRVNVRSEVQDGSLDVRKPTRQKPNGGKGTTKDRRCS